MFIAAAWLVWLIVVLVMANTRGRSLIGWFIITVFLTPLFSMILLLILPNLRKQKEEQAKENQRREEDQRRHEQMMAVMLAQGQKSN